MKEKPTHFAASAGEGTLIDFGNMEDFDTSYLDEQTGGESLTVIVSNDEEFEETGK